MNNGSPQKCDLLIRNGYAITMDPERSKHLKGAVAVDGNTIVAVGPEEEVTASYSPLRVIDAEGRRCLHFVPTPMLSGLVSLAALLLPARSRIIFSSVCWATPLSSFVRLRLLSTISTIRLRHTIITFALMNPLPPGKGLL